MTTPTPTYAYCDGLNFTVSGPHDGPYIWRWKPYGKTALEEIPNGENVYACYPRTGSLSGPDVTVTVTNDNPKGGDSIGVVFNDEEPAKIIKAQGTHPFPLPNPEQDHDYPLCAGPSDPGIHVKWSKPKPLVASDGAVTLQVAKGDNGQFQLKNADTTIQGGQFMTVSGANYELKFELGDELPGTAYVEFGPAGMLGMLKTGLSAKKPLASGWNVIVVTTDQYNSHSQCFKVWLSETS